MKVYDFGDVHKDERAFLRHQFNYDWRINDIEEESSEDEERTEKKRGRHSKSKNIAETKKSTKTEKSTKAHKSTREEATTAEETSAPAPSQTYRYVRARYVYTSSAEGHLNLQENDLVLLMSAVSEAWWNGRNERTLETGMFPSNYVKEEAGSS